MKEVITIWIILQFMIFGWLSASFLTGSCEKLTEIHLEIIEYKNKSGGFFAKLGGMTIPITIFMAGMTGEYFDDYVQDKCKD